MDMVQDTDWMAEDSDEWMQSFVRRVTDNDLIAEVRAACADTHWRINTVKEFPGLQAELFIQWCKERLGPGEAWAHTGVVLWTPPPRIPISFIASRVITAGIVTLCVYKLCTSEVFQDLRILSPDERVLRRISECFGLSRWFQSGIQFSYFSKIKDAIIHDKRKVVPEGEKKDNEQKNPRGKRAKSEELISIHDDRRKKLELRRKGLAMTKGLPSVKEDEVIKVKPRREGLAMTMQLESSKRATSLPPTLEGCSSFVPHSASVLRMVHTKPLASIKEDEVGEIRLVKKGSALNKPLPSIEADEVGGIKPLRKGSALTKSLRSSTKRTI